MLSKKQQGFYDWVVYQIYPRSFLDTNGDGVGDLCGITEKLDYLKELGINAIWITPCFKSPNEDNGYDISDYESIGEEYGSLDDFKLLVSEMHKRGMKVIMDFVANHTSSEHKWFKEAKKSKDNPYRDYYYWADEPINDWKSVFGSSVWEYDETTNQYYLHSFAKGQPDLNWENPKVREEMVKVIDFWVDLGVDGFRCDVLDRISKDFEKGLKMNGPRLHEYIQLLFNREKTKHLFTIGECWGANKENIKLLVDGDRGELSTIFQFDHFRVGRGKKFEPAPFKLDQLRDILVSWQKLAQEEEMIYTLFFENHDLVRSVTRFGDEKNYRYESATMLAAMMFLQKGMPFIYQGEEIGVTDSYYDDIKYFDDIETHNYYNAFKDTMDHKALMDQINFGSRDNTRHPIPWNDTKNGGFSEGEPWIPYYQKYKEINVEKDIASDKSIYKFYQKLLALRAENDAFRHGIYEDMTDGKSGMYIYSRSMGKDKFIVVCNFEAESELALDVNAECVLSNSSRTEISGKYMPYECAVYRVK